MNTIIPNELSFNSDLNDLPLRIKPAERELSDLLGGYKLPPHVKQYRRYTRTTRMPNYGPGGGRIANACWRACQPHSWVKYSWNYDRSNPNNIMCTCQEKLF